MCVNTASCRRLCSDRQGSNTRVYSAGGMQYTMYASTSTRMGCLYARFCTAARMLTLAHAARTPHSHSHTQKYTYLHLTQTDRAQWTQCWTTEHSTGSSNSGGRGQRGA